MFHSKFPKQFYYLLAVLLVIFLLGIFGVVNPARGFFEKVITIPLKQKVFDWQRKVKKDLDSCQFKDEKKISELELKVASLLEETSSQKRLLSAPLPKNWQFLPVKVIEVGEEMLTISAGKNDGVKEGMVAIIEDTYLGKISHTEENMSQIKLASFLDERLLVKIVSVEKSAIGKGLLVGRGMGTMKIEQVLFTERMKKGNLIATDVDGKDLLVGEVEEVSEAKGEVFASGLIKRTYALEELNTIFLIKGKL